VVLVAVAVVLALVVLELLVKVSMVEMDCPLLAVAVAVDRLLA
jgi:hypothetical protein